MRLRLAYAVFLLFALAKGGPAGAAPAPAVNPDAKAHLDRGLRYYNTADYGRAADEFKAAYDIDPQPSYLYALAQAYRLGQDCPKAILVYKAFLRTGPPAEQATTAERNIKDCETALAVHTQAPVAATPSAEEPGGGAAPATVPPVATPAGPHETQPATTAPPPGANLAETPVTPAAAPSRAWWSDPLGWTLVGAGVVGMGLGAYLFSSAANDSSQATAMGTSEASYNDLVAQAHTDRVVGGLALGVGALLAVGGVVKFVYFPPPVESTAGGSGEQEAGRALSLSATPLPGGAFLSLGSMY